MMIMMISLSSMLQWRIRAVGIHMSISLLLLLLLLALPSFTSAQLDTVRNFCRRFGHQTAVIDRRLYIDGGFLNYNPLSQYPTNYSNTGLFYQDLDVLSARGMPQLYANLTKNASIPSVSGGTLWADTVNKRFYLFGGEYEQQQQAPSSQFTLWSFNTLSQEWESFGQPAQTVINGVSYGAGVSVSERGEGYYYGGWMSMANDSVATSTLIRYDMDANAWTNSTGPDSVRRAEGAMVFLPIGDGGMLVYFGGVQQPSTNGSSVVGQPMEQVFLYDVLSSKWYVQNATGTVPQMRRRFCAGAAWAADQSSYNIYIYGGAGMPPNTAGFDDVYILTIPSFQWIKLYPSDGNVTGQYPHHSLTCNVVAGNSQMLIVGGTFPTSGGLCDVPDQFGTHNLDLGQQNPEHAPWYLFSPNLTTYAVPKPIRDVVGGSAGGGATRTTPARGFANPDLKVLMTRKASIANRTPTRAVPEPTGDGNEGRGGRDGGMHLSTGAIAGIVVGAVVAAVAVLLGCCRSARRRHRRRRQLGQCDGSRGIPSELVGSGTQQTQPQPWSPASCPNTTSTTYTPTTSPYPMPSLFLSQQQQHPSLQSPPVELEAPPPGTTGFWYAPSGVQYELLSSETTAAAGITQGHGIVHNTGGNNDGIAREGSPAWVPQTKIDSEGRVWVQVATSPAAASPSSIAPVSGSSGDVGGGGVHDNAMLARPTPEETAEPRKHLTYYHP
ncbi:hypothetical protein B0H66DRAFT_192462 [Apodospora peruviana]|uniref:Kelch repeat-containing protein n=1 Tax=Apodospora peruviana TaxID=516989 RepID=A0AAE0IBL4_9PEZI|nr:hypothetical protein B0H66DRAFT_192462 [Apodospora peruviana]